MYTVDYFISKFEKIPKKLWAVCTREHNGSRCALGWCYQSNEDAHKSMFGIPASIEEKHLIQILAPLFPDKWMGVGSINNGLHPDYQQKSAKQRILAALYDIKKMQEPVYTDITKDLAVLPVDKIETDLPVKELNHV